MDWDGLGWIGMDWDGLGWIGINWDYKNKIKRMK